MSTLPLLVIAGLVLVGSPPAVQTQEPPTRSPQSAQPKPEKPQTPDEAKRPTLPVEPKLNPDDIPVSLDKIQKALSQPPAITVTEQHPVFRVEIFGRQPTIMELLGPDFLASLPQQGAMPMYHQEFLNRVTPPEFRGYAGYTNLEGLQMAGTSFLLQYALQRALQRYQDARTERAREAARREVERALQDLREARRAAGLPER